MRDLSQLELHSYTSEAHRRRRNWTPTGADVNYEDAIDNLLDTLDATYGRTETFRQLRQVYCGGGSWKTDTSPAESDDARRPLSLCREV